MFVAWVCAVALVLGVATKSDAGNLFASISLRNPKQATRVVNGDTVANPFDYELIGGLEDDKGWMRGHAWMSFERENGVHYTDHEEKLVLGGKHAEVGWLLSDRKDDKIYVFNLYAAKKLFHGIVGIGVSWQAVECWTRNGAWMSRFSIEHKSVDLLGVQFALQMILEQGKDRQRAVFHTEVKNVSLGENNRVAVVPMFQLERVQVNDNVKSSYQAKIKLVVRL